MTSTDFVFLISKNINQENSEGSDVQPLVGFLGGGQSKLAGVQPNPLNGQEPR